MCLLSLFKIEKKTVSRIKMNVQVVYHHHHLQQLQTELLCCLVCWMRVSSCWLTQAGHLDILSNVWKSWHHHIGFVTFRIVFIQAFLANVQVKLINLFGLQPLVSRGQRACRHQHRAAHGTRLFGSFSNYELFAWLKTSHRPFHPYELDLRKSKQKGRAM